jgi:uroporphyrinogen decarboxylase
MNKIWTSRERVQAALEHREPDRVPISLTLSSSEYQKLREYLGFPPDGSFSSPSCEAARMAPDVAAFLGVDLAWLMLRGGSRCLGPAQDLFFDEWQIGRRFVDSPDGSLTVETRVSPLAGANLEDLRDFPWPDPQDPGRVAGLEQEARDLFSETGLALVGRFGGPILATARDLRGAARWEEDVTDNPDFACALLNRVARVQIALDEAGLNAAGKYLSILEVSELAPGTPDLMAHSEESWYQTILPILQRRWNSTRSALRSHAPQARLMFSAGSLSRNIFEDMINGGVSVFSPLVSTTGTFGFMELKRAYGSQLSFIGGVDAFKVLLNGQENDVRHCVKDCLSQLGAGGGFVLAPAPLVQPNTPPRNIVAMCETAKVYGRYSAGECD